MWITLFICICKIFSEIPYKVAEIPVSRLSNALALVTSPQVTLTWASLGKSWARPLPKSSQSDHCFLWHFPIGINCLFLIWMNFWLHNWKKVKNIKSMDSALEAKLLILHNFCQQEPNKQSVIKAYNWAECNLPSRILAPYAFVDKEVSSFWISGAPFGGTPVSSDNMDFLCVKAWGTPCHTRLWLSTVILSKA